MIQFDEWIHYGKLEHAGEFSRLHEKCREAAYVASFLAKTLFGEILTTTSIYRKKTTDSGVHEEYRAIDFAPLKSMVDTYCLIDWINGIYTYDEERPEKKVADENPFHGTGFHIHIQVHDHTTCVTKAQTMNFLTKASQDKTNFHPQSL